MTDPYQTGIWPRLDQLSVAASQHAAALATLTERVETLTAAHAQLVARISELEAAPKRRRWWQS